MKVTLTFDPTLLTEWAAQQKGVCCDAPVHDKGEEWALPALTAQGILAHALLSSIPPTVLHDGSVQYLDTGVPKKLGERIEREYNESLRALKGRLK